MRYFGKFFEEYKRNEVPCPHCGPGGMPNPWAFPDLGEKDGCAYYECRRCGGGWRLDFKMTKAGFIEGTKTN